MHCSAGNNSHQETANEADNAPDTLSRSLSTRVHGSHPYSCESIVLYIEKTTSELTVGVDSLMANILNLEKINRMQQSLRNQQFVS
jgi:hypothetical protein